MNSLKFLRGTYSNYLALKAAGNVVETNLYFTLPDATPVEGDNKSKGYCLFHGTTLLACSEQEDDFKAQLEALETELKGLISANTESIESLSEALEDHVAEFAAYSAATNTALEKLGDDIDAISGAIDSHVTEFAAYSAATDAAIAERKVKEVAADDKVLALDENGVVSSQLTLDYVSGDKKIYLKGQPDADGNAQVIGEVDTTDFIKDGMLADVQVVEGAEGTDEEGKTFLEFSFNTDGPSDPVKLDVTKFLNGTELKALADELAAHVAEFADHVAEFAAYSAATDATLEEHADAIDAISGAIDSHVTEFAAYSAATDEAIAKNVEDIADNAAEIVRVEGKVDALSGEVVAHVAEFAAYSADTNAALEELGNDLADEVSARTDADAALQEQINALSGEVSSNEEVVAAALADLKKNTVVDVVAEEESNVVVTKAQDENGIVATIGFEWLSF